MSIRQLLSGYPRSSRAKKLALAGLAAAAAMLLAGCDQYLSREDKIVYWAGEANAHNIAVQVVDPWPRHAFQTRLRTPGVKAEAAMKNYRKGDKSPGKAANFSPTISAGGR